jgi:hypothetical protein
LDVVFQEPFVDILAHNVPNVLQLVPLENFLEEVLTYLVVLACYGQFLHDFEQLSNHTYTFLTTTLNGFSEGM